MPTPHLSKSRYLSGLQCDRRLWLDIHVRDSATPLSDSSLHILGMGIEVGRAAHNLFPNGVLVNSRTAETSGHAAAVAQTRKLMADESIPALFEAAFEHENLRIRVDVLERLGNGRWGLREVKSGSSVRRARNLPDLAVQKWVLEGCGLMIASAELIHVNGEFVRGEGEIDWKAYFKRVELLEELAEQEGPGVEGGVGLAEQIKTMHRTLAETEAPFREPGAFCKKPHVCGYWEACSASKSASWKVAQTGANAKKRAQMIEVTESGVPWLSDQLAKALETATPPVWALDFEALAPAIPFYPGARPFEAMAFQWSLHRLSSNGASEHFEFLADGRVDPRPEVARSLIEVLGRDSAPILVYSPYEKTCLKDMARCVPELREELDAIVARLVDLLPIVRAHVYHPDLLGSFSIKKVGPAFAPGLTYAGLNGVADGTSAMGAFARIVRGELAPEAEATLRDELLAYCKLDTWALIEVFRGLREATR